MTHTAVDNRNERFGAVLSMASLAKALFPNLGKVFVSTREAAEIVEMMWPDEIDEIIERTHCIVIIFYDGSTLIFQAAK